jgi:dUTP pyrophosphatase
MSAHIDIPITSTRSDKTRSLPRYMSHGAAGLDLAACIDEPITIHPNTLALIGTGYAVAIPEGYEGQVRPRSGLALKHQLGILNSPGTIDSDYRGEIKIIMFNFGKESYTISDNDRIAQLVISALPQVKFKIVEHLDVTERGSGGYGHTGRE